MCVCVCGGGGGGGMGREREEMEPCYEEELTQLAPDEENGMEKSV